MRTTKKEFKEQVRQHVLDCLGDDMTPKDVYQDFIQQKFSGPNEIKYYKGNKHAAFTDWMMGVPSSFNVDYTNHDIHNSLKSWYENLGETYDESKQTRDESEIYFGLVAREFKSILKNEGVDF